LGAYRIPLETGLLIPSEKRAYRHVGIKGRPDDDKRTSQDLAMAS